MRSSTDQSWLRLHHFLPASLANGPGRRAVVWLQGCTLGCPGCFNPETHAPGSGKRLPAAELAEQIIELAGGLEGVSISGGEPLQQISGLAILLREIRQRTSLSVLLFSGFTWDEIGRMPQANEVLTNVDVLLAGRYDSTRRIANGLIGSANKSVHFLSTRYTSADLDQIPTAEIILDLDGTQLRSGIDPLTG